nr:RHS repeat-associated core domain-containing protein [Clostridium folliculivorans]
MYNGHGDVTNLLDGKGGIIGSYYYDAFRNVQENTSTFSNPYRYAGYQYDEEIGKYYLLNRMYDPESARFMQEDTYRGNANDPLSLNLYTYVNNNPMIYDDQNGHWPSFIDNFVSGVKSAASSAWSYVKETASNIYNTVINLPSTISSGFNYVKDTVYNWGKQTVNNIRKTYNTAKTVYNKVVKPVVTNYVKQKVEEVKTGIAVKAGEVANFVKNINVPQLVFGGISVGVGALATVTGVGLMAVPGLQLVGAGIIAAGVGSIAYGAGEMLDSTAHINPIRDFAVTKLGMSNVEYDLTGAVLTGISGYGIAGYGGLAAAGRAAMKSQANNSEVKNEVIPQAVAGDNKGSFLKGIPNVENDVTSLSYQGAGNAERQLLSGSEWNEYFKQTYGSENVEWVTKNKASFGSRNLLEGHFDKHGSEFGGIYSNADEYLQGAKDVMNNGYKVEYDYKVTDKWGMKVPEQRTGYMRFMGNNRKGEAKFEFVGTNNRGDITTYHTESGKTLWKLLNGSNTDKTINPVK